MRHEAGIVLIAAGTVLIILGTILGTLGSQPPAGVSGGVVILIGPIPLGIGFGEHGTLLLITAILAALLMLTTLLLLRPKPA